MSDIPGDIMRTATEIVDRIAKQHVWKGDCVADVSQGIFSERQRADASKALCDEMAKALEQIQDAHPTGSKWSLMNDGTWREACRDLQRIARLSLAAYRKEKAPGR